MLAEFIQQERGNLHCRALTRSTFPLVCKPQRLSDKLKLTKAFRYTIDRREALTLFVTDRWLEADNNVATNAMRGIVLGREITSSAVRMRAASGLQRSTLWWRR